MRSTLHKAAAGTVAALTGIGFIAAATLTASADTVGRPAVALGAVHHEQLPQAHPASAKMLGVLGGGWRSIVPGRTQQARASAATAASAALRAPTISPGSHLLGTELARTRAYPGAPWQLDWLVSVDVAGGYYGLSVAATTLDNYTVVYVSASTGKATNIVAGWNRSLPELPWVPKPGSAAAGPPSWANTHGVKAILPARGRLAGGSAPGR